MSGRVIFTDLDGTLLDASSYSFAAALPALHLVREREIPLVICSSKTASEIEYYRTQLDNRHPFVSENGGGIFVPKDYFGDNVPGLCREFAVTGDYLVMRLGARYEALRKAVGELQAEGFRIKGFGDMSPEEVAALSGITLAEATMAKERDFDEPFLVLDDGARMNELLDAIVSKGFRWTQGAFFHLMGCSDKGMAVSILIDCFRTAYGDIRTIAVGDGLNDLPMLQKVDHPVLVQKPDGTYDPRVDLSRVIRAGGVGPVGWNMAINELVAGRDG